MRYKKTLKYFLVSVCSASLLLTGCTSFGAPAETSTVEAVGQIQSAEAAFDALTRELFTESVQSDSLTLNYMLKDPAAYNIELDEATWGTVPMTEDALAEGRAEVESYLNRLNNIDISSLSGSRAVDADVLRYYLELNLESYDYAYMSSSFTPSNGFQCNLPTTLAEYHFDSVKDVEDYLTLLNTLDDYMDDLLEFENLRAEKGYGLCKSALESSIEDCRAFIESPETNLLIEVFPGKLESLPELSDKEKNDYIDRNRDAVQNSVIPAYEAIIDTLSAQIESAPKDGNLSSYKNGQDYYKYLLKSTVGTDKTPEELIELTEKRLYSSLFLLALIGNQNPDIYDDLGKASYLSDDPREILEHFKTTFVAEQMPEAPAVDYNLKYVHESLADRLNPAMYLTPRLDDFENNQIYLNLRDSMANELMPTLAHEGYPGHMYQYTYYYNTNPNPIRAFLDPLGYVEGWASYVEYLSYQYCGFSEDVADYYAAFNSILALNLYCRVDLGIHYEGWDVDQVAQFVRGYFAFDDETIQQLYNLVLFYPAGYPAYGIGMDEILEMRETMEANLGDDFDVKDFHRQLLDLGPVPFSIARKYMPDAVPAADTETD